MAINLEIGVGSNPQPGYVHSDFVLTRDNRQHVDIVFSARQIPFRNESVDGILMFGVFEHFGIYDIQEVMLEIFRVLKPSGSFRFDVPDFDWFVEVYRTEIDPVTGKPLEPHRDERWVMHAIFGGQDGPGMEHKWGWSQRRLEEFLRKPNWPFSAINFLGRQWRDAEENHLIYECVK